MNGYYPFSKLRDYQEKICAIYKYFLNLYRRLETIAYLGNCAKTYHLPFLDSILRYSKVRQSAADICKRDGNKLNL